MNNWIGASLQQKSSDQVTQETAKKTEIIVMAKNGLLPRASQDSHSGLMTASPYWENRGRECGGVATLEISLCGVTLP